MITSAATSSPTPTRKDFGSNSPILDTRSTIGIDVADMLDVDHGNGRRVQSTDNLIEAVGTEEVDDANDVIVESERRGYSPRLLVSPRKTPRAGLKSYKSTTVSAHSPDQVTIT